MKKLCGLVIRVSTDRQAANEEGSLTNQLQRLEKHIEYKNEACGEDWSEAGRYVLKGVSGKDSVRSPEFARLFADIQAGKVNTVLCTALDRVSRSVKDFLNFFEFLSEHGVEFVCLKQDFDTTTPHGRAFAKMMMVMAELEREQTSERTRDATAARAERGLWNGAMLFGYDPDPLRKGYLVPNEDEAAVVRFAFSHYLECGSLLATAKELNRRGFRTKKYESRRDKHHKGSTFSYSSVQYMLKNLAYIGKKEVNKKRRAEDQEQLPAHLRYKVVDAVWPPIVDKELFHKVGRLLKANDKTRTNGVSRTRHVYVLNRGLLW
jgi:site-specific DNA recombinase